jgi:small subunit ribosomal protein S20
LQIKKIVLSLHPHLNDMANHKSALKRIRQNEVRRLRNRYYKTARTALKVLRNEADKTLLLSNSKSNLFVG